MQSDVFPNNSKVVEYLTLEEFWIMVLRLWETLLDAGSGLGGM